LWPKLAGKWLRFNRAQRLLLLEAAWALAAAQVAVRLLPFRWITPRLGRVGSVADRPLSPEEQWQAQQVGWAIMKLARFLPWDARCLAQAVAGKWMLRRRGLPSTLYLGVDRGRESWLEAHAWLRCGTEFVTGQRQHERFTVLATFAEERP
jgi:hypothetical protein